MSRVDPARISAREGWTEIAMALDRRLAPRLRESDASDLDDDESSACLSSLHRSGVGRRLESVVRYLSERPRIRQGRGRLGAPSRDGLRARLRVLHAYVRERLGRVGSERSTARVIALLILVRDVDQHGAWWGARDRTPPTGRRRITWIAQRVRDLVDDGAGQYAERRARRAQATVY